MTSILYSNNWQTFKSPYTAVRAGLCQIVHLSQNVQQNFQGAEGGPRWASVAANMLTVGIFNLWQ